MPLLMAKRAINGIGSGELVRVLATDPGSVKDFKVFSEQSGHVLVESEQDGDTYRYLLKKKSK